MGVARIYNRLSTLDQKQFGYNMDVMKADCHRKAAELGLDVAYYEDVGSAKEVEKRKHFLEMCRDLQPGDLVISWKFDRIFRDQEDQAHWVKEWRIGRATLVLLHGHADMHSPEGRAYLGMQGVFGQLEREQTAVRVRSGMKGKLETTRTWLGGPPPFGYDLEVVGHNPRNGKRSTKLVPNESDKRLYLEIITRYLAGAGTRAVALWLNSMGVQTKQGKRWTSTTVSMIIRNPIYIGRQLWGKRTMVVNKLVVNENPLEVEGVCTPLIDEVTWERVQQTLAARKSVPARTSAGDYPLTGLAVCGLCGNKVHGWRVHRNDYKDQEKTRKYRCSQRALYKSCTLPYFPAYKVEAWFLEALTKASEPDQVQALVPKPPADSDIVDLRQREAERKRALENWSNLLRKGELTEDEYAEESRRDREALREIRKQLTARRPEAPTLDLKAFQRLLKESSDTWKFLTSEERKQACLTLRQVRVQVVVYPDHVEIRLRPEEEKTPSP